APAGVAPGAAGLPPKRQVCGGRPHATGSRSTRGHRACIPTAAAKGLRHRPRRYYGNTPGTGLSLDGATTRVYVDTRDWRPTCSHSRARLPQGDLMSTADDAIQSAPPELPAADLPPPAP